MSLQKIYTYEDRLRRMESQWKAIKTRASRHATMGDYDHRLTLALGQRTRLQWWDGTRKPYLTTDPTNPADPLPMSDFPLDVVNCFEMGLSKCLCRYCIEPPKA